MNLDLKAAYEQSIVFAKSHADISIEMLRKLSSIVMKNTGTTSHTMFDEHIRNLEQIIHNYRASIEDDGVSLLSDVGTNVGINVGTNERLVLELIRANNRITAKEVSASLSVSLRQSERIMAGLREKGLIKRIGSNKSGHWEIRE